MGLHGLSCVRTQRCIFPGGRRGRWLSKVPWASLTVSGATEGPARPCRDKLACEEEQDVGLSWSAMLVAPGGRLCAPMGALASAACCPVGVSGCVEGADTAWVILGADMCSWGRSH